MILSQGRPLEALHSDHLTGLVALPQRGALPPTAVTLCPAACASSAVQQVPECAESAVQVIELLTASSITATPEFYTSALTIYHAAEVDDMLAWAYGVCCRQSVVTSKTAQQIVLSACQRSGLLPRCALCQ